MHTIAEMEELLEIDPAAVRKFENMMIGYFGLRDARALYKLREMVELSRELFDEDLNPRRKETCE